jgi:hypothetical protein
MNNLFTSKGGVILFLLLIFQFGLKLQASAHVRMACDTDTTINKKAKNSQVIKSDTALILKAGSTIVKNADTIMIINGVPTKVPINSQAVKAGLINGKTDSTGTANTTTITAPPTDGTIQVKNPLGTPINTTIVAPPTDGVIQVKDETGTMPTNTNIVPPANDGTNQDKSNPTATPADGINPGRSNATITATDSANPGKSNTGTAATDGTNAGKSNTGTTATDGTNAGTTATDGVDGAKNANPAAGGQKDTTAAQKTNTTIDGTTTSAPPQNGVIQVRNPDTSAVKKNDTTLAKKADSTLMRRSDTTSMKSDTADSSEVKAKGYYLEVGGAGLAISANYDSRFNKTRDGWGYRIGLGGFIAGGNNVVTVPFQINYLIGDHSSMFEVGAGTTFLSSRGDNKGKTWEFDKITGFIATGSIGYRYQPEHKGINFRLVFVPILYDEGIIPAGGISIGYTFK